MAPQKQVWIASSHPPSPEGGLRRTRVLLAMTVRHSFAISPHAFLREVFFYSRPLRVRPETSGLIAEFSEHEAD
jgi:hypothetical protein